MNSDFTVVYIKYINFAHCLNYMSSNIKDSFFDDVNSVSEVKLFNLKYHQLKYIFRIEWYVAVMSKFAINYDCS